MIAIPWIIDKYKRAQVSYKRLNKVFNLEEEKIKIEKNTNSEKLMGNIKINNLTYSYPGFEKKVLKNINLEVKCGERLGIIGILGSGKTTITNLLLRLYSVENNKIFIDGVDINEIDLAKLRENICYITQDNFLFSTSIKENVNLFRDNYKDEEIEKSVKSAMIHEDIIAMPNNVDTVIGEKGVDLSGGQKQRVVISRAFLKNSSIVIFDDTFSALDNKTQEKLLYNVKDLIKNKTCIIISNRISDIKDCDKIIVLEQGEIVEKGNHTDLLEKKNKYYNFYKDQISKPEESMLS